MLKKLLNSKSIGILITFIILLTCFVNPIYASNSAQNNQITTTDFNSMQKNIQDNEYTFTISEKNSIHNFKYGSLTLPSTKDAPIKGSIEIIDNLPQSYDLREKNAVTPVKDQGQAGSCWAFATCGAFESNIKMIDNNSVDLSEQYLISCNNEGYTAKDGGWFAHDMHVNPGAVIEEDCPYQAKDVKIVDNFNHPYKLDSWGYVNDGKYIPSVDEIKSAIIKYGAVAAAVTADSYFSYYSGGVYNRNNTASPNHAIILIGWDDSKDAWILRNSYGPSWGESGYMYIDYDVSNVGYGATYIVYSGTDTPSDDDDTDDDTPVIPNNNIALNKLIDAHSYYDNTYLPEFAVDGDLDTRWAASPGFFSSWITIDLGESQNINKMKLLWSNSNFPKNYTIYTKNDFNWINQGTVSSDGNWDELELSSLSTRYIKLKLNRPNSSYYVLYEWEIYE